MATITHITNPFDPINNRNVVLKDGGSELHTYFDEIDDFYEVIVSVNGQITEDYSHVVCQNDSISFVAIPKGGGGGGKNILATVAMVALVVAAPYAASGVIGATGAFGGLAVGYAGYVAVLAGVMIGGGMLINALFPPATPDFNNPSLGSGYTNSSTYSWGTQTNSIREGIALPITYGTARIVPPIISQYVETIGNKQYLNLLMAVNDGEVDSIGDIYINDNPIAFYNDVTSEVRLGTNNQTLIPSFDNTRVDTPVNAALADTFTTRQGSGNTTNELVVTLVAPSGLYYANDKGGLNTITIGLTIEYREVGSGTWLSFVDTAVISGNQNSAIRATYKKDSLTPAQYEVQVKRNTAASTNSRTSDGVVFEALTEVVYDDFIYPNTALLSIRALATDQLSGGIPKVSSLVTANSNNPSLVVQDILTNWAGVASANILAADFTTWETFCTTNGYEINIVFDTTIDVRQALDTVSQLGRATVLRMGSTYLPIIDKASALPTQGFLFTMGNIVKNSFAEEFLPTIDRSNVLEITYFDETLDYERQSFELYQNGFDESTSETKKSSIALYGCTNRAMAIKHGRYLLNKSRYLTLTVSFEVAIDAIACRVGDVIIVAHDVPQWGFSGRIRDAVTTVLTLDKEITMLDDGTQYVVTLRLSETDEIINKNVIVPVSGYTGYDIEVESAFALQPVRDDVYSFGELTKATKEFRVLNISTSTDQLRKISALEYVEEVYIDDADTIPVINKSLLEYVSNLQADDAYILGSDNGSNDINVTWFGSGITWDVYYKPAQETDYILAGTSSTTSFQIKGLPLGTYDIRVGEKTTQVTLLGDATPLPNITGLISYYKNEQTILTWDEVNDVRSPIDYEIRMGTVWEDGAFVTRTPTREFAVTSDGDYMVKAHYISSNGAEVYSETEAQALIEGAIISKNIVASYDEKATNWVGSKTNVFINEDGNLQMAASGLFDDIPNFDSIVSLDYYGGIVSEASYEIPAPHIVDVGTAQKCRLWVDFDVNGLDVTAVNTLDDVPIFDSIVNFDGIISVTNEFTLVVQIAIAGDDEIFGAWKNFNAGDYVGRKFKFRGLFYSYNTNVTVILSKAIFYVDMEDKIQSDDTISVGSGGVTITYPVAFQVKPSTNITIVNATDGDEIKLTNESESSFDIQVTNGGAGVARTINWLSKGY